MAKPLDTSSIPAQFFVGDETTWEDIEAHSPLSIDELKKLNKGVDLREGAVILLYPTAQEDIDNE